METIAVIMAGGRGERFWPVSRKSLPKQFISLTDDGQTLIQKTARRISELVAYDHIVIVTNGLYRELVLKQLPEVPPENILLEPAARNTAPCIGFAAAFIQKKFGDSVMFVLPSDHLIKNNDIFSDTLMQAAEVAMQEENLVTIGIYPSYPETGYGYINYKKDTTLQFSFHAVYRVVRFVEKPNIALAQEYVESGRYLWNSGIFVWKSSSILSKIAKFLPETSAGLMRIQDSIGTDEFSQTLEREYPLFKSESIDFSVMEKAEGIFTIPGSFGWDDVGNWLALERTRKSDADGNVIKGSVIALKTENSIIEAADKLFVVIGIEDVVVVDTPDATLICSKQHTQEVKKAIEIMASKNYRKYL